MPTKTVTAKPNGSENLTAAAKAAASDYEALKEDIAQLRSDLQSLAGNSSKYLKGNASAQLDKNIERGKEYAEKASKSMGSAKDYAEDKIKANPLTAVGLAFGTGVLLAALRRK